MNGTNNLTTQKRWNIAPRIDPDTEQALSRYPGLVRQVLYNRGITGSEQADAFFNPQALPVSAAYRMKGMRAAVERILKAKEKDEKVAIYGDYDVDGVTASVLLVEALEMLGIQAAPYIPHRFEEGYGINTDALDKLRQEGYSLVLSVDCGVRSIAEAEYARQIGLDLVITDHHTPQDTIPSAVAVINPKQPGDEYPYKDLAGVGVAYKLACALFEQFSNKDISVEGTWLDLVAVGTVADMAPLTEENRAMVRAGIEWMKDHPRVGLQALCEIAGSDIQKVNATTIGFTIGPRLNAAGRIENAMEAYNILYNRNRADVEQLAGTLQARNAERQQKTRDMVEVSVASVLALESLPDIIFSIDPEFSEGVVGLAASRLVEQFYRPAVVGRVDHEKNTIRCSCRSIPEFHITMALDKCADLMLHHGGHAAAAGFTIRAENLAELQQRLLGIAAEKFRGMDLVPGLSADAVVKLNDLGPLVFAQLQKIQPFGYGNREIQFVTRGLRTKSIRTVGQDGKHLKLWLSDGYHSINAIAFNKGHLKDALAVGKQADYLYVYDANEWNGSIDYQLNIKDIHI